MSKCGLDECDLYGGCLHDCEAPTISKEQARADLDAYSKALARNDINACIVIEKKYDAYGLSPQGACEVISDVIERGI